MLREGQTERFSFQDITDSQASVTQNIAGLPVNYSQPLVKYVKEFFHKQKDHHSKFNLLFVSVRISNFIVF